MKELQKDVYVWDLFHEREICTESRPLEDLSEKPDAPTVPDRAGSLAVAVAISVAPGIIKFLFDELLVLLAGYGIAEPEIILAFISPQGAPITASIIVVTVLFFNWVEKCNPDWLPELTYGEIKEENLMPCVSGVIQDVYYDDFGAEPSTLTWDVLSMGHPFFKLVPKCADRNLLRNAIIENNVVRSPMITCVLRDRNVCKMAEGAFIGGAIGGTLGAIGGGLVGGSMAAGAGLICIALGPFCLLGALVIGIGIAIFGAFGGATIGAHAARTRIERTEADLDDEGNPIKGLLLEQGDLVNVKGTLISRGGQTMFRFVNQKHSSYLGKVPREMRPEPIQDEDGNWVTVYSHHVPDNLLTQVYKDTETGEYSFEHIDPCHLKP